MRSMLPLAFVVLAGLVPAQSFDCQPLGPFPPGCCSDCEDVWSNNVGLTGVSNVPSCGFPVAGAQYARIVADAIYGPGPGIARPVPFFVSEIRVVVPEGATGLTFKGNWINAEDGPSAMFNDGMEIAIVASDDTTVLVPIAYVDTFTPLAPGMCQDTVVGGTDSLLDGPDTISVNFAAVPFGSYLSFVIWNGGDTAVDSSAEIDCIAWGNTTTPGFERGNLSGPRIVDLTPATSFRLGVPMTVRMDAGLPFLEGNHCMVGQIYDFNSPPQFITPGIAGALFIRPGRPFTIMSEGLLTGGAFPGRSQPVSFTISDPAMCGAGLVIQAYVITEQLTNQTWTTALFGWVR